MSDKRAFLVLGPESSGTRLATQILLAAGCTGSAEHYQPLDRHPAEGDLVVWRRSVPHAGEPLDLGRLLAKLHGYQVQVVVTVRDPVATRRSQIANGHSRTPEQADAKIRAAYVAIFGQLAAAELPYELLVYEALVLNPREVQRELCSRLGLPAGEPVTVTDENAKWFQTHGEAA